MIRMAHCQIDGCVSSQPIQANLGDAALERDMTRKALAALGWMTMDGQIYCPSCVGMLVDTIWGRGYAVRAALIERAARASMDLEGML